MSRHRLDEIRRGLRGLYRVVILLGLVLPGAAWAKSASQDQILGRAADCIVDRGVGAFDIATTPGVTTALYFPSQVVDAGSNKPPDQGNFHFRRDTDALYVTPFEQQDVTSMLLVTTAEPRMRISLYFHVTDDPDKALRVCRFVPRDAAQAEAQKQQQVAMIREQLFSDGELRPVIREMHGSSSRVIVRLGRALYHQGDLWSSFSIENQEGQPLRLANIQVLAQDGAFHSLTDVVLESPARPHAEALAQIPVGQRAAGIMRLPGLADGAAPQEITFTGFAGARMVVATVEEPTWVFIPKREEEVRQELLDKEAEGTISLHLQGAYGAIWLGDGAGLGQSHATSLRGLGVRATYAFSRKFAVEGEILGASTGEAEFRGVTWNGMQGELARSAALGRVQFGGVMRLGERYRPILRLGVGLQGASHSGTLATATGEMPGPESFEWTALATFGAGMDVRLSQFLIGFLMSVVTPWGDLGDGLMRGTIEAGIHLGYRWKP